ncbi:MAG TPA: GrpB family protein [Pyrinomonadaceae bacterium]|jgi:GrpB-like predicted nucleotidyltransferase (UPF0157 family)
MLGLTSDAVALVPHTELWHQLFTEEAARLRAAAGAHFVAIEHVGSTSVCGLSAKPILDIAAAVRELADVGPCVAPLADLGYEYRGAAGIPGRRYFVKGEPRTHHLHVAEWRGDFWRTHLLFRDYLRRHAEAAAAYEALKRELAQKYRTNRVAYTEGKAAFIEHFLRLAEADAAG